MVQQALTAATLGVKQHLRNALFVVLLVLLPPAFITLSFLVTPEVPFAVTVPEGGQTITERLNMARLHGAIMVPITVTLLSGLLGLFVMLSSREADRRLVAAGYPGPLLLAVRLAMVAGMSVLITLISVGVSLIDFRPEKPGLFLLANLIAALHYGFIGAIIGTFLSALGGTYLVFFIPMIDLGVVNDPMFTGGNVSGWATLLPGYTPMKVLLDVSFTGGFDTGRELAVALVYLVVLAALATFAFWRATRARG
ncbi:MAG: hypothetical protein WA990_15925 [Rubrobacteraceae bacterium]